MNVPFVQLLDQVMISLLSLSSSLPLFLGYKRLPKRKGSSK